MCSRDGRLSSSNTVLSCVFPWLPVTSPTPHLSPSPLTRKLKPTYSVDVSSFDQKKLQCPQDPRPLHCLPPPSRQHGVSSLKHLATTTPRPFLLGLLAKLPERMLIHSALVYVSDSLSVCDLLSSSPKSHLSCTIVRMAPHCPSFLVVTLHHK